jgi:hypothetical protein
MPQGQKKKTITTDNSGISQAAKNLEDAAKTLNESLQIGCFLLDSKKILNINFNPATTLVRKILSVVWTDCKKIHFASPKQWDDFKANCKGLKTNWENLNNILERNKLDEETKKTPAKLLFENKSLLSASQNWLEQMEKPYFTEKLAVIVAKNESEIAETKRLQKEMQQTAEKAVKAENEREKAEAEVEKARNQTDAKDAADNVKAANDALVAANIAKAAANAAANAAAIASTAADTRAAAAAAAEAGALALAKAAAEPAAKAAADGVTAERSPTEKQTVANQGGDQGTPPSAEAQKSSNKSSLHVAPSAPAPPTAPRPPTRFHMVSMSREHVWGARMSEIELLGVAKGVCPIGWVDMMHDKKLTVFADVIRASSTFTVPSTFEPTEPQKAALGGIAKPAVILEQMVWPIVFRHMFANTRVNASVPLFVSSCAMDDVEGVCSKRVAALHRRQTKAGEPVESQERVSATFKKAVTNVLKAEAVVLMHKRLFTLVATISHSMLDSNFAAQHAAGNDFDDSSMLDAINAVHADGKTHTTVEKIRSTLMENSAGSVVWEAIARRTMVAVFVLLPGIGAMDAASAHALVTGHTFPTVMLVASMLMLTHALQVVDYGILTRGTSGYQGKTLVLSDVTGVFVHLLLHAPSSPTVRRRAMEYVNALASGVAALQPGIVGTAVYNAALKLFDQNTSATAAEFDTLRTKGLLDTYDIDITKHVGGAGFTVDSEDMASPPETTQAAVAGCLDSLVSSDVRTNARFASRRTAPPTGAPSALDDSASDSSNSSDDEETDTTVARGDLHLLFRTLQEMALTDVLLNRVQLTDLAAVLEGACTTPDNPYLKPHFIAGNIAGAVRVFRLFFTVTGEMIGEHLGHPAYEEGAANISKVCRRHTTKIVPLFYNTDSAVTSSALEGPRDAQTVVPLAWDDDEEETRVLDTPVRRETEPVRARMRVPCGMFRAAPAATPSATDRVIPQTTTRKMPLLDFKKLQTVQSTQGNENLPEQPKHIEGSMSSRFRQTFETVRGNVRDTVIDTAQRAYSAAPKFRSKGGASKVVPNGLAVRKTDNLGNINERGRSGNPN